MKAIRVLPHEFPRLKRKPKINDFWKSYFNNLSVEFSKQLFHTVKKPLTVRLANCESFEFEHYYNQLEEESLIQFFNIYPHNTWGFYYLPYKTVNLLLTNLLGGSIYQEDETKHEITNIDHKVLSIVVNKMVSLLQAPLEEGIRNISIELLDTDKNELLSYSEIQSQNVCVQEYLIEVNGEFYPIDLVFSSNFLESFSIL
jgi:flagellar motor switch protein FliM